MRPFATRLCHVLLLLAASCASARASPVILAEEEEDVLNFGTYNQNVIDACSANGVSGGCGPVATINSFVYLQNQFPREYTSGGAGLLVPDRSAAGINKLAQQLSKDCGCTPTNGATAEALLNAKIDYIRSVAPGSTTFESSILRQTNGRPTGGAPTMDFLMQMLALGEDVEVLIGIWHKNADGSYTRTRGHWLTLTGGAVTDSNHDGLDDNNEKPELLSFIDPAGAVNHNSEDLTDASTAMYPVSEATPGWGTVLQLDIPGLPDGTVVFIDAAIAESPSVEILPEPSSAAVLLAGLFAALGGVSASRRRTR